MLSWVVGGWAWTLRLLGDIVEFWLKREEKGSKGL